MNLRLVSYENSEFESELRTMSNLMAEPGHDRLRVSVAMCTYNGEAFLPLQLESISSQTLPPDELIVCDDGSEDATLSILKAYADRVPFPVRITQNSKTLRPAQNFAQCIEKCAGDIILLTDQDDLWFNTRIQDTERAFRDRPSLTFVFSECPLIDAEGKDLSRSIYSSLPISARDRKILLEGSALLPALMRSGMLYGTTMAFRADLRTLLLPLPALWSHDEWIGLVLSAAGPSARLNRPVTHYRQHAAQQVGTGNWTLGTHLGLAQKHTPDHYDSEMLRFRTAIAAVQAHGILQERLLPMLEEKLAFLENRRKVQSGDSGALRLFCTMLFSRSYARFGSATRSPVKDLMMNFGLLHRRAK